MTWKYTCKNRCIDGTPYDGKLSCTVRTGGKATLTATFGGKSGGSPIGIQKMRKT